MDDCQDEGEEIRSFASPACLMHEVDPAYLGLTAASDPHPHCSAPRSGRLSGAAARQDEADPPRAS